MLNRKKISLIVLTVLIGSCLLFVSGAKAPNTGTLQVFSEEEDVYIYINGYLKGKNSVIKKDIQVGEHYIKAVKGKRDGPLVFSKVVRVKKGEVKTVVIPVVKQTTPPPKKVAPTTPPTTPPTTLPTTTTTTTTTLPKIPGLPIKVIEIDPSFVKQMNLAVSEGLYVEGSGIKTIEPGDIVLSIDNNAIKDIKFYKKFLGFMKIGDKVLLEILKKDKKKEKIKVGVISIQKEVLVSPEAKSEEPTPEAKSKAPSPEATKLKEDKEKAAPSEEAKPR